MGVFKLANILTFNHMRIKRVNIGEEIKKKVIERQQSIASFAKAIGIQRQNIEKTVFSKNSLDTDLLMRISEELDYNFFSYYTNEDVCNIINYSKQEVKATLTIELGEEKKDQVFRFIFGDNNLEIKNK